MEMRTYRLEDHEPYAKALEKHSELTRRLRALQAPEGLATLEAAVQRAENTALELEAEALLDSKATKKAEAARKKAADEAARFDLAAREARALQMALDRLNPELNAAKDKAEALARARIRKDHEAAVTDLMKAWRTFTKAYAQERAVVAAGQRAVSGVSYICPVNLAAYGRQAEDVARGDGLGTLLGFWENHLRNNGYDV